MLADHAELATELELLKDQYSSKESDATLRAIETAREELATIEREHADLFRETAA